MAKDCTFNHPFTAEGVIVQGEIEFENCTFKTGTINFHRATVGSDVRLSGLKSGDKDKATGPDGACIDLKNAHIHGELNVIDSHLGNGACALDLTNAVVRGDVRLDGSTFSGETTLQGAFFGNNLYCLGTEFHNPGKDAISARDLHVNAFVRFSAKVHPDLPPARAASFGLVDFSRAHIKGDLVLEGASLVNPGHPALAIDHAMVEGGVYLTPFSNGNTSWRFECEGSLSLVLATVKGDLDASSAAIVGPNASGFAIVARGAKLRGSVYLWSTETTGIVSFKLAEIGGDFDCRSATFTGTRSDNVDISIEERDSALYARGITIGGKVMLDDREESHRAASSTGRLHFEGANVGGNFEIERAGLKLIEPVDSLEKPPIPAEDVSKDYDASIILTLANAEIRGALRIRMAGIGDHLTPFGRFKWKHFGSANDEDRTGTVDLSGLTLGTLDDDNGKAWDGEPHDPGWLRKRAYRWIGRHLGWRRPVSKGVMLKLDGLTYKRIEVREFKSQADLRKVRKRWLKRQYPGDWPKQHHYFPQPFQQLSTTLREMGYASAADGIAMAKRSHLILCGADRWDIRLVGVLYWIGFGFGFAPLRALLVLAAFYYFVGVQLSDHLYSIHAIVPVGSQSQCTNFDKYAFAAEWALPIVRVPNTIHCWISDEYGVVAVLYMVAAWLLLSLAALTFAGILRRD
ncbi:MAG: hypothetical protein ABSD74_10585 [Rhizomicrobium sp.]